MNQYSGVPLHVTVLSPPFFLLLLFLPCLMGAFTHYIGIFLSFRLYTCRPSKPPLEHLSHQTPLLALCELRQPRLHCSGVFSTLMRPGEQLQCIQCGGSSFCLDILCFLPFHVFRGWALVPGMSFHSGFSMSEEKFLLGPVFFVSNDV